jgi:DNA-binding transcriptional MerR regulator
MDYGVEALAHAAGVTVDTIRFYQAKRLLPAPRRAGRRAVYSAAHLARLRRIRRLQADGVPLAVIRRLLAPATRSDAALARALTEERGRRTLSRAELAAEAGVPEELITAVERAGIMEPLAGAAKGRYAAVDVELARQALRLLREGVPLTELLALAIHHGDSVREVVDRAIELFDQHVRRTADGRERPADEVVDAFRRLLPSVTALVAHHFHRTLVARALARLERLGDTHALKHALAATKTGHLEVTWR